MNDKTKKTNPKNAQVTQSIKPVQCLHSPDGYHEPQKKSTIAACQYCGKIL